MLRRLAATIAVAAIAFFSFPGAASASAEKDPCIRILGWAACL